MHKFINISNAQRQMAAQKGPEISVLRSSMGWLHVYYTLPPTQKVQPVVIWQAQLHI